MVECSKQNQPVLWCLRNPLNVIRKVSQPDLHKVQTPSALIDSKRPPIIFIHGAQYHSPTEILSDLVVPMLEAMRWGDHGLPSVYFAAWDSKLIPEEKRAEMIDLSPLHRTWQYVHQLGAWPRYLADLERRADDAARFLAPYVMEWTSQRRHGPTVISHSLGGYVWAQTMQEICLSSRMLARPGLWWNLQPALVRNAFTECGSHALVARMYHGSSAAKTITWYSRLDFVLSTLYMLGKRQLALGQWGCPQHSLPQRDITSWAREAHGMNHIDGAAGHFFKRLSHLIPAETRSLGIIA